jgi:uncharacterized protein (DUF433 family)
MINGIKYPHITSDPTICGGAPCIAGSRIPVRTIGAFAQRGVSADILLQEYYPWLSKGEIYAALAYYYDHLADVEAMDITEAA